MLSLLEPDMYTRVRSLFEAMNYHLAVMTVLTGKIAGEIYVDDLITPQTSVLIPSNQHRQYVAGSTEDGAVNKAICTLLERPKLAGIVGQII